MNLISHVQQAFEKAELFQSKISQEIKDLEGMTGEKTRHFYNNLLNMPDVRYLEIGVWKGSSCCAAMFGNACMIDLIDDFSGFGSPVDEFRENLSKYTGRNAIRVHQEDCFKFDISKFDRKFNIYLFDGDHSHESQRKGLEYYLPAMEDEFIFIIDDWNFEQAREGTFKAVEDNKLNVRHFREIRTSKDNSFNGDAKGWWNGIAVFIFKKL